MARRKVVEAETIGAEVIEAIPMPPAGYMDGIPDFGPFDELGTFHMIVIELGFDPDAEVDIPIDVATLVERITGMTATNFAREHQEKLNELLNSDEAAMEWWRQQQTLMLPEQIALPAGPAEEPSE